MLSPPLSLLFDALLAVAFVATGLLPGLALTARLPGLGREERWALSAVAGLALVGFLLGLLALAGWFDRAAVLLLLAGLQVVAVVMGPRQGLDRDLPPKPGPAEANRLLWLPALGILPVALLLALYPSSAFDDTMYHLPLARSLAFHGSLVIEPQLRFPVFPLFHEVRMAALLVLGGSAGSTHFLACLELLLLACLVALWARQLSAPLPAALATALLLGCPLLVWLGSTAYVDLALALFTLATLWICSTRLATAHPGWLALAGGLAGVGAAIKYHGLFFLGAAGLAALVASWRQRRPAALATFLGAALLTAAPWYLRNVALTGNPVFPFATGLFGPNPWSMPASALAGPQGWSLAEPGWPGASEAIRGLGALAYELARLPLSLLTDSVRPLSVPPLSPFAALVLPLAGFVALVRRDSRWLASLALVYLTLWLLSVRDDRYLAPALGLLAVLAAQLIAPLLSRWESSRPASGFRRWLPLLAIASLVAPAWGFAGLRVARRGWPPLLADKRQHYLDHWLPGHALLTCAGRELGPKATVYGLGTEQLQFYAPGTLLGDVNGPYRHDRVEPLLVEPAGLEAELRGMGADALLLPVGRLTASPFELIDRCQGFELWRLGPARELSHSSGENRCGCAPRARG